MIVAGGSARLPNDQRWRTVLRSWKGLQRWTASVERAEAQREKPDVVIRNASNETPRTCKSMY